MPYCEDFPCCGHEAGCCPSFDESGKQLDMVCTCGARLPVDNRYSICDSCMQEDEGEECDDYDDSMDGDHDSCMRDIGWGTDEDYGYYGD